MVSRILIDPFARFQVLQEEWTELSEDVQMGVDKCALQIEEKESRENHFIHIRFPFVSKDWFSSLHHLLKRLHLVQVIHDLQVCNYLELLGEQLAMEAIAWCLCCLDKTIDGALVLTVLRLCQRLWHKRYSVQFCLCSHLILRVAQPGTLDWDRVTAIVPVIRSLHKLQTRLEKVGVAVGLS